MIRAAHGVRASLSMWGVLSCFFKLNEAFLVIWMIDANTTFFDLQLLTCEVESDSGPPYI